MIRFDCDYTEGAHPRIIEALTRTNMEQCCGYGLDEHCERARAYIRAAAEREDADVHFLVGGTQANATVIAAALRPYQGVLCPETGHINCHETGAVEATGHKALPLPAAEGKISARQVENYVNQHFADVTHEHIVQPGMVYISQPTEYGTLYSKAELEALYHVCREKGIYLFIDGARLGYALAADESLTLPDMARLCDVFYIGGTKVGALFGEAVLILNEELKRDFRYMIKRHGGMLAKGRLLGIQFEELFRDGLYLDCGRRGVQTARAIRSALLERGIELLFDSPTNQLFPVLTKAQQRRLEAKYALSYWQAVDPERDALRVCTSWATKDEDIAAIIADIKEL